MLSREKQKTKEKKEEREKPCKQKKEVDEENKKYTTKNTHRKQQRIDEGS